MATAAVQPTEQNSHYLSMQKSCIIEVVAVYLVVIVVVVFLTVGFVVDFCYNILITWKINTLYTNVCLS